MGVVHAEQARLIGAAAVVPDRQRVPVGQLGSIAVDERARVGAGGPDLQVDAVKVDPAALPFAVGRLGPGWWVRESDQAGQGAASVPGIRPIPWLIEPRWAMVSLCLVSVWRSVPFATVVLLAAMQGVPETVYEAARIDGAGEIRQFVSITVPLIRGALSFVVVISIIHAFQAFDLVYVLTGANGGPETATYVLGIMLFQHAFSFLEFGYASALAWVMFAILLVLTVLQLRITHRRSWEASRGLG